MAKSSIALGSKEFEEAQLKAEKFFAFLNAHRGNLTYSNDPTSIAKGKGPWSYTRGVAGRERNYEVTEYGQTAHEAVSSMLGFEQFNPDGYTVGGILAEYMADMLEAVEELKVSLSRQGSVWMAVPDSSEHAYSTPGVFSEVSLWAVPKVKGFLRNVGLE